MLNVVFCRHAWRSVFNVTREPDAQECRSDWSIYYAWLVKYMPYGYSVLELGCYVRGVWSVMVYYIAWIGSTPALPIFSWLANSFVVLFSYGICIVIAHCWFLALSQVYLCSILGVLAVIDGDLCIYLSSAL